MPVISRFLGIAIAILYRDHDPPHFHAIYGDYEITVNIVDGTVNGRFPRRASLADPPTRVILLIWRIMLHVTSAQVLAGHCLLLQFNDGTHGVADVAKDLHGPIFEELLDPDKFSEAYLDPELRTVCWPNGADLAPEFLKSLVLQKQPA
jgi:hypothetical protein